METEPMGRVTVAVKIENLADRSLAERGLLPVDQIRSLELDDARVDMNTLMILMPR